MQHHRATYFKSLIMLMAFGLHSITGFACSISPWLHQLHHAAASESGSAKKEVPSCHEGETEHEKSEPEDCCAGAMALAQSIAKFASKTVDAPDAVFVAVLVTTWFSFSQTALDREPAINQQLRWRRLSGSPPNLYIALRTFRI